VKDSGTTRPCASFLQAVVADRRRGVERLGDIARIELVHRAGVVSPHAGIAVGLELHAHRDAVLLGLRAPRGRLHLLERPRQLLHVMADLVRDYVGLGKVPRRAEPSLQIAEEREVEVEPSRRRDSRTAPSPLAPCRTQSAPVPRTGPAWERGSAIPSARPACPRHPRCCRAPSRRTARSRLSARRAAPRGKNRDSGSPPAARRPTPPRDRRRGSRRPAR
jgi:hypothetical protein